MKNGRPEKLRRRGVALENRKLQLQTWKETKPENIISIATSKVAKDFDKDEVGYWKSIKLLKISKAEEEIKTLENRLSGFY